MVQYGRCRPSFVRQRHHQRHMAVGSAVVVVIKTANNVVRRLCYGKSKGGEDDDAVLAYKVYGARRVRHAETETEMLDVWACCGVDVPNVPHGGHLTN